MTIYVYVYNEKSFARIHVRSNQKDKKHLYGKYDTIDDTTE